MVCVHHLTLVQRLNDKSIKNNYGYSNLSVYIQYKKCKLWHQKLWYEMCDGELKSKVYATKIKLLSA